MTPENLTLLKRYFNYLSEAEFNALVKMIDAEAEKKAMQEIVLNKLSVGGNRCWMIKQ
jgi:hypothetical protein